MNSKHQSLLVRTTRAHVPSHSALAVLLVAIVAVTFVGTAVRWSQATAAWKIGRDPLGANRSVLRDATRSIPTEEPIYDLAYDDESNSLWYLSMSLGGPDFLCRYNLTDVTTDRWELPNTDHNGYLERVSIAPDHAIWLTEEYQLLRFDATKSVFGSVELPLEDRDAVHSALAADGPSPGTWPSAIAFDENGTALIARHNVAALTEFNTALQEVGRIAIPDGSVSPADVIVLGDSIYVTQYDGDRTLVITSEGSLLRTVALGGARLARRGSEVFAVGSGGAGFASAAATAASGQTGGSERDLVTSSDDETAVFDASTGTIYTVSEDGSMAAAFVMPTRSLTVHSPDGRDVATTTRGEVGALAIDSRGDIWFSDVSSPSLMHLVP